MGEHIRHPSEAPQAYLYVIMRDSFLSGWGEADGKDCIYVYPCDSHWDAQIVEANAKMRDDQDRISIERATFFSDMPRDLFPDNWHVMVASAQDSPKWYERDAFSTEPCDECEGSGCEHCDDTGRVEKVS